MLIHNYIESIWCKCMHRAIGGPVLQGSHSENIYADKGGPPCGHCVQRRQRMEGMREEREADEGRENWRFILLHRCIDLGMAIQIDIESRCGRDMDDGR